jgi:hypothetical protein
MAALHSHTLTHPRGTGSRTRALDTAEGVLIGIRRIPAADAFDELVSAARRPPPRRVRLHPRRGPGRARQRKRGTPACRRPRSPDRMGRTVAALNPGKHRVELCARPPGPRIRISRVSVIG